MRILITIFTLAFLAQVSCNKSKKPKKGSNNATSTDTYTYDSSRDRETYTNSDTSTNTGTNSAYGYGTSTYSGTGTFTNIYGYGYGTFNQQNGDDSIILLSMLPSLIQAGGSIFSGQSPNFGNIFQGAAQGVLLNEMIKNGGYFGGGFPGYGYQNPYGGFGTFTNTAFGFGGTNTFTNTSFFLRSPP